MKLVFNPSPTDSVVYNDDGQMIAPGEWAYVDETADGSRISQFLSDQKLLEVPVPTSMPSEVHPMAAEAITEAVADQTGEQVSPKPNDPPQGGSDGETDQVSDTGSRRKTTSSKKEA